MRNTASKNINTTMVNTSKDKVSSIKMPNNYILTIIRIKLITVSRNMTTGIKENKMNRKENINMMTLIIKTKKINLLIQIKTLIIIIIMILH